MTLKLLKVYETNPINTYAKIIVSNGSVTLPTTNNLHNPFITPLPPFKKKPLKIKIQSIKTNLLRKSQKLMSSPEKPFVTTNKKLVTSLSPLKKKLNRLIRKL